jgi:cytochrome d ubiquinol oxidase subunit I
MGQRASGGLQFAFTITCPYLFPQLTMGLGLLIVILQTIGLGTGDERTCQ